MTKKSIILSIFILIFFIFFSSISFDIYAASKTPSQSFCKFLKRVYIDKNRPLSTSIQTKYRQCLVSYPYLFPQTSSISTQSKFKSQATGEFNIMINSITDTVTGNKAGVIQGNPLEVVISIINPLIDYVDRGNLKAEIVDLTAGLPFSSAGKTIFTEYFFERNNNYYAVFSNTNSLRPTIYKIKISGCLLGSRQCKTVESNFLVCSKGVGSCKGRETNPISGYDYPSNDKEFYEEYEMNWSELDKILDKILSENTATQSNETKIVDEGVQHSVIPVLFFAKDSTLTLEIIQQYAQNIESVMSTVKDFYKRETGKIFSLSGVVPVKSSKPAKYYSASSTNILTVAAYLNIVEDTIRELRRYRYPTASRSDIKKWAVIIFPVLENIKAKAAGVAGGLYILPGDGISRAGFAVIFDQHWMQFPERYGLACYNIENCVTSRITAHELGHLFGLPERYGAEIFPGASFLRNAIGIQRLTAYCNGKLSRECAENSVMGANYVPLRELYLTDEDKEMVKNHYLMFKNY